MLLLTMFALSTVISVGNAPPPNLVRATESLANLEPAIFALVLMSSLTIVPFWMFVEVTTVSYTHLTLPTMS